VSVLIVGGDEGIDLLSHLPRGGEAGASQGMTGEDGKPGFHLVQLGGVGRGEVKMDILVARPPAIVFGLMGVQVVQDDVNPPAGMAGENAVHEVQELEAPAAPIMAGFDQTGGHLQSCEQCRRAMAFVLVVEAGERLAIRHPQPSLGALQSLVLADE